MAEHEKSQILSFNEAFKYLEKFEAGKDELNDYLRVATILQYAKIAEPIHPEDRVRFGLYEAGAEEDSPSEWTSLTKHQALSIEKNIHRVAEYQGGVHGSIHAFYKGTQPQYFTLRHAVSGNLIRCNFASSLYDEVVNTLERPDYVVYVDGKIKADLVSRKIEEVQVKKIKMIAPLSEEEYQKFFGMAPNYTGSLTTEEFVNLFREENE